MSNKDYAKERELELARQQVRELKQRATENDARMVEEKRKAAEEAERRNREKNK